MDLSSDDLLSQPTILAQNKHFCLPHWHWKCRIGFIASWHLLSTLFIIDQALTNAFSVLPT